MRLVAVIVALGLSAVAVAVAPALGSGSTPSQAKPARLSAADRATLAREPSTRRRIVLVGRVGRADEIADAVRRQIGAISLQSVYDALGVLVAEGLLRRIQPAGSPARFEDRVGDNHHHLICRVCGRTVDIDCAVGAAPCLNAADDMGYEIDEAEVVYWGRCPDCSSA
jgi:Fur family ferric uptake transcriptional regulator